MERDGKMTIELTIEVPDALGRELQHIEDRLPEVLERGLREVLAETSSTFQDERTIIDVLTNSPTAEQVLALRPSPEFQARTSELLARSKQGVLSPDETRELDRIFLLEHLVRMAKANVYRQQAKGA
jgi:hypothetical protein